MNPFKKPNHPARVAFWEADRARFFADLKFAVFCGALAAAIPLLMPAVIIWH